MENRSLGHLSRLLDSLSDLTTDRGFKPVSEEPLTPHRRGQWFKSSTAHHAEVAKW